MVTTEKLKQLKESMPYKYRLQSAKYGKATVVSYVDSRAVQDRFDDICGEENWKDEYSAIDGKLFCGISILVQREDRSEWVQKWDVGTESNMEAEKGNVSDSFKRAAIKWGVGRFLYSLGIITLKTGTHKDKEYPCTDEGKILWGVDELTEYCKKVVASGELDRTKPNVKPLSGAPTATPQATSKVTPTKTEVKKETMVSTPSSTGALQPSKEFSEETVDPKVKALELFSKLDDAVVLKHLIKSKFKYTQVKDFVNTEPIEKVREVYGQLTAVK